MKCPTCESCEYAQYCGATEIMRKCERHNKKVEQTNEEWLHTLNTEQLAEWMALRLNQGILLALRMKYHCDGVDAVREWLKQPHEE